ncbi:MAG: rod shape-determining protein MreC [Aquificota bacterium]|nr:MAG: rod shape-determining protein MreC [Aquificota bacterium]
MFPLRKIVLIPFVLFFFILGFFLYFSKVDFILDILYPFQNTVKNVSDFFSETKNIIMENHKLYETDEKLRKELNNLKLKLEELKYVEIENKKLRNLLGFQKNIRYKRKIGAEVIGYPSQSWVKGIIVNAGKNKNIKVGDIVISDGYLIGKITKVSLFSSFVLLVNDSNFKITGRTKNTREFVFYKGNGKDGGYLEYIKQNQDIRVGDIVETNSPKGIPIGIIEEVSSGDRKFFKSAKVKAFVKQYNLEYVLILGK